MIVRMGRKFTRTAGYIAQITGDKARWIHTVRRNDRMKGKEIERRPQTFISSFNFPLKNNIAYLS